MNNKYLKLLNTFFVVLPMTFIMALVAIARNYGFEEGWSQMLFSSWIVMAPVAYVTAFFIIPIAGKVTARISKRMHPIEQKKSLK
ncbi:DUF2798 domain-containing protein [Litoribacter populi]|uniref:DUF2798 domain-containing protein n=1 Tax=Litoribacter populi TaxID=2598460 RepID=UPI00117C2BF9|nr:DUF2798 domain-containing protein [Litoribacter populi]